MQRCSVNCSCARNKPNKEKIATRTKSILAEKKKVWKLFTRWTGNNKPSLEDKTLNKLIDLISPLTHTHTHTHRTLYHWFCSSPLLLVFVGDNPNGAEVKETSVRLHKSYYTTCDLGISSSQKYTMRMENQCVCCYYGQHNNVELRPIHAKIIQLCFWF